MCVELEQRVRRQRKDTMIMALCVAQLQDALTVELKERKMQVTKMSMTKIIQLYETKLSRHSVMTVGCTQSAKTVSWRVLQATMGRLNRDGDPNFQQVKVRCRCAVGGGGGGGGGGLSLIHI